LTKLPQQFLDEMKNILKDEYDDFIKSYEEPKTTGLRVKTLKMTKEKLVNLGLFKLNQIPWSNEGFYYDETIDRPGKNPLHEAGAYYLQEPSAMSVVPKAEIKENDKVLDMCAAPGGKSTYILSKLNDTGLLVSNEINPIRIKALGENLERFGARNCIITNTDSSNLKKVFAGYFDKVIIDAPCSGQGMFRKDEVAISDWSYAKVLECQSIQREIIRDGYEMLNNGGILVYSTCTFAKEENEVVINEFIEEYPNAKLIEMERLWPHKVKGEGHFVAKIQKLEEVIYVIGEAVWLTEKFGNGEYQDVLGLCKLADRAEIAEKGYSLTPGAYVGVAPVEGDGVDFATRMAEIHSELLALQSESNELMDTISKNMKEMGL
jgi:NOL1/NOP2/sun family putative RNA methylase